MAEIVNLDFADTLHELDPDTLSLELMGLAVAVNFDAKAFVKAARLEPPDVSEAINHTLYRELLKAYAERWRETGSSTFGGELDESIRRWQVIAA